MNQGAVNLLNVARALREAQGTTFKMTRWGYRAKGDSPHPCGTPACALGHYAVRVDLQDVLTLNEEGNLRQVSGGDSDSFEAQMAAQKHFEITSGEFSDLFSYSGCDGAQTREQAAEYIEAFVQRKWPLPVAAVEEAKPVEVREPQYV